MSFPRSVNVQPAIAVEGDRASANDNAYSVVSGVGAFLAGPAGVTVGAFAWLDPTGVFLNSFGSGLVTGFIQREGLRADILTPGPGYPSSSMTVLPGSFLNAFNAGDYFVRNNGTTAAVAGQKCYANFATGLASFGAAGSPPSAATLTTITLTANTLNVSSVAVNAFSVASIAGNVLTVTTITTGGLFPGQTLAGTGVDPNTTVVAQLTGTAGSTGTYTVSINQTVGATAMTGSGGWLHVTSMTNGVIYVGQTLSGGTNAFTAGTTVLAGGTGTGTAGYYPLNIAQTLANTATATGSGGYLTLTTLASGGTIVPGDTLITASSTGSPYFLPYGTGGTTGVGVGAGTTYVVSNATGAGDTSGSVSSGVETKWSVAPGFPGAVGELVAITSVVAG